MQTQTTNMAPTPESVWAFIQESNRYLTEKFAETAQESKETERRFKETERLIKEIGKKVGGIANSNGCVAEEYFINSFAKDMKFAGQKFYAITANLKKRNPELNLKAEYDIVLENNTSIAIIEVKYKAEKEDIEPLIKKVETFKLFYPQHANFNFYLGLAGLSVSESAENEAVKQGIAIIKQVGDRMVINEVHLKVF